MYRPPHFSEDDPEKLRAFITRHPFACVVAHANGELAANHLPLQVVAGANGGCVLKGHIARANDLWQQLTDGADVLAIFTGADAYITPSWYAAKATTGEVVPTWNYAVVHAHGTVRFEHDRARLRELVGELTDQHEASRRDRWSVADAPDRYVERMLSGIVGIEIAVTRLEGKFKASQNRSAEDRARVRDGLTEAGAPPAARDELVRGS